MKNVLSKLALISLLSLITCGSAMAVSYDSSWSAYRKNGAGTTTIVLPPHAGHFCYLSKVTFEETDTSGEWASCRVRRSGTVWLLEARLGKTSDADAYCSAYCYNK